MVASGTRARVRPGGAWSGSARRLQRRRADGRFDRIPGRMPGHDRLPHDAWMMAMPALSHADGEATARSQAMTAAELMTPSPRTCSPYSTVTEASLVFRD